MSTSASRNRYSSPSTPSRSPSSGSLMVSCGRSRVHTAREPAANCRCTHKAKMWDSPDRLQFQSLHFGHSKLDRQGLRSRRCVAAWRLYPRENRSTVGPSLACKHQLDSALVRQPVVDAVRICCTLRPAPPYGTGPCEISTPLHMPGIVIHGRGVACERLSP